MAKDKIRGITIELGADTSKLMEAFRNVDKQLKQSTNSLKDIDRLLKLDPKNTELLTQKYNTLETAIGQSKQRLQELTRIQDEMVSQGKVGTAEWDALQREIINTQQDLKSLEQEYKEFGSVAAQQVKVAGEKMQQLGDKMANVGKSMTTYVTTPIVTGFAAAVKKTMDFDSEMSKVKAISGATEEEFQALRDKAIEMGDKTKFSAAESAEALEYMAMAGWKTEDMLSGIEGIMALAAASGEELGTTSDIVTDALTAFGMTAADSGHFADILAAASSNANTNVSMLGESFKYAAAPAGALGYSAEDVALALGLMANSGIKADMAGTSLRNLFTRMAKPTKESAEAMDRLGLELYDDTGKMYSLREIMEQLRGSFAEINMPLEEYNARLDELDAALEDGTIKQKEYDKELEELNLQAFGAEGAEKARAAAMLGGARAMSGLLAIANATEEDFDKLAGAIDHASDTMAKTADGSVMTMTQALEEGAEVVEQYNGAADQMSQVMMDNASGDWTILASQVGTLAIQIGDILMPAVRDFIQGLQGLVTWLNSLDEGTQKTIVTIALVVAAIGPLLLIGGKLVSGVGTLLTLAPKLVSGFSSVGGIFTKLAGGGTKAATAVSSLGSAAGSAAAPAANAAGSIGTLAQNAVGFIALGAGILLAAAGLALLAQSAIALAEAGPTAGVALLALIGTLALFAAGAAALAPALTAGAVGLVAFGAAVLGVGAGVFLACEGLAALTEQLPTLVEYGGEATLIILGLSGAIVAFSGAALVLTGGLLALTPAILAASAAGAAITIVVAALTVALAALTLAVGALAAAVALLALGITALDTASEKALDHMEDRFKRVFNGIKDFVGGVVDWLKGIFNFKWELPKLKLPHFSIKGEFSLNPPSVPTLGIDWYRKAMTDGMILTSPTIFGAAGGHLLGGGEAGPEAVVGVDSLKQMVTEAAAAAGSGGDIIIPVYLGTRKIETLMVTAQQKADYRSGGR
ncbi:MAG: phage tail tape measure protein [Lachnospiraceae bacterium]|nr:phage tail tape measure protein [Lachnospiraceae bacterium]